MAPQWIEWPVTLKLFPNHLEVNGIEVPYMLVAEVVNELTHPNPRKWIRLERMENIVVVSTRIAEEEPNGTPINTLGNGEAREQGTPPPNQAPAHPAHD